MSKTRFGYMCKIDFDYELGEACGGTKVHPSIEDLKRDHDCWAGCGIVKVKVILEEVVCEGRDDFEESDVFLDPSEGQETQ